MSDELFNILVVMALFAAPSFLVILVDDVLNALRPERTKSDTFWERDKRIWSRGLAYITWLVLAICLFLLARHSFFYLLAMFD